jgi:hypothetical protein
LRPSQHRRANQSPLTVGGIRQASEDVFLGQLGKVVKNLLVGLSSGEPAQHIRNRDPHVADATPVAALARFDGNDALIFHDKEFSIIPGSAQEGFAGHSVIAG